MFSCLDTSVVSTALVSISSDMGNYEDAPWVILSYLLTYMSEHQHAPALVVCAASTDPPPQKKTQVLPLGSPS